MGKRIDAIKILILINVIFFALTYWAPEMMRIFVLYFPQSEHFRIWQLVSHIFMHAGFAHILLNMYGVWAFGTPLEENWGKSRFLLFYFLCGIGAGLVQTLANYLQFQNVFNDLLQSGLSSEDIYRALDTDAFRRDEKLGHFDSIYNGASLGASGAVYGIMVAFGFLFPETKLALIFFPVPIAAKFFIPIVVGIDLFSGLTGFSIFGEGIGHFAHVGGALIGFILMLIWRRHTQNMPPPEEVGNLSNP